MGRSPNLPKKPCEIAGLEEKAARRGGGLKINGKELAFALEYLKGADAKRAAKIAGYANPAQAAHVLMERPRLRQFISANQKAEIRATIACRDERLEILTAIARRSEDDGTEIPTHTERIAACKLMAAMQGELVKRTEVSGPNGGPITVDQMTTAQLLEVLELKPLP